MDAVQVKAQRVAWTTRVGVEAVMRREAWGAGQRAVGITGELALGEDRTHQHWMGRRLEARRQGHGTGTGTGPSDYGSPTASEQSVTPSLALVGFSLGFLDTQGSWSLRRVTRTSLGPSSSADISAL